VNTLDNEDLEIGVWPPVVKIGVHTNSIPPGIYMLHKPSGVGVIATSGRSQHANRHIALKALNILLAEQEVE
jgi:protein subunit release factor A